MAGSLGKLTVGRIVEKTSFPEYLSEGRGHQKSEDGGGGFSGTVKTTKKRDLIFSTTESRDTTIYWTGRYKKTVGKGKANSVRKGKRKRGAE